MSLFSSLMRQYSVRLCSVSIYKNIMNLNLNALEKAQLSDSDSGDAEQQAGFKTYNPPFDQKLFGLTEKQKELRQVVANLVLTPGNSDEKKNDKETKVAEVNESGKMKKERINIREMGKLGLLGIRVKKDFGGQEGELIDCVIVQEELAQASVMTAFDYNMHVNYCIHPIAYFGTNEQKLKYLPKMCSGEVIGIMTLPKFNDKSGLGLMALEAEKKGNHYILNGIGAENGPIIDIIIAYAITDHNVNCGVTAFIVEKSFSGFAFSKAANGFIFHNCKVPASNILGKKHRGQEILFSCMTIEKVILAGGTIGFMQSLCNAAFNCALNNNIFTEFKSKICRMYTKLCSSRSYLYTIARSYDTDHVNPKDSAAVILYCTEKAAELAHHAEEILNITGSVDIQIITLLESLRHYEKESGTNDTRRDIVNSAISYEYK